MYLVRRRLEDEYRPEWGTRKADFLVAEPHVMLVCFLFPRQPQFILPSEEGPWQVPHGWCFGSSASEQQLRGPPSP